MFVQTLALSLTLSPEVQAFRDAGHPRVARAVQVAAPEYREAVALAVETVDPEGERPWLELELWRICLRESRCGQYGSPSVHGVDSWTGARSYAWAVHRGRLEPERCEEHRLIDYAPALRSLRPWERERRQPHPVRAVLLDLDLGSRRASEFATRGGWGMNASRALRWLWPCAAPEALDEPRNAALAAARALVECERGGRPCTCSERASMWIGSGTLRRRPLWSRVRKSRVSSVAVQCGGRVAIAYAIREVMRLASEF